VPLEQGRGHHRRVVGPDAGTLGDQAPEGPVGGGRVQPVAGAVEHGRLTRPGRGGQRRGQAGLAQAPAADERHRRPLAGLHRPPGSEQPVALALPADHRRPPGAADPLLPPALPQHLVDRHGRAVGQDHGLAGLQVEAVLDQPQQLAADHQRVRLGGLVELGRQVGGVPEGQQPEPVLRGGDQHLAGVHGDPHRQWLADLGLQAGREAA
jgi:hypothetical protein